MIDQAGGSGIPEIEFGPTMDEVVKQLRGIAAIAEYKSPQPTQVLRSRANLLAEMLGSKSSHASTHGAASCAQFGPEDRRAQRAAQISSALGPYFESAGNLIETAASGPTPPLTEAIATHGRNASALYTDIYRYGDPARLERVVARIPQDLQRLLKTRRRSTSPSGDR